MKLPRLTTRRLLALVALVALGLGLFAWMLRRAGHFRSEASRHLGLWLAYAPDGTSAVLARRALHHWSLAEKYEQAASRPWLPVASDPPEPE